MLVANQHRSDDKFVWPAMTITCGNSQGT